jgi:hypothetical protein
VRRKIHPNSPSQYTRHFAAVAAATG